MHSDQNKGGLPIPKSYCAINEQYKEIVYHQFINGNV